MLTTKHRFLSTCHLSSTHSADAYDRQPAGEDRNGDAAANGNDRDRSRSRSRDRYAAADNDRRRSRSPSRSRHRDDRDDDRRSRSRGVDVRDRDDWRQRREPSRDGSRYGSGGGRPASDVGGGGERV